MSRCSFCGQVIRTARSVEISRRFHAWVTWMTQKLDGQRSREEVYWLALLKAVEIDPPEGGAPYRYAIVADVVRPIPTSEATNKEMMTACRAVEYLAFEWNIGPLPERPALPEEIER